MADQNWQKVREVFDVALQQPLEERQNYISKACGDDKDLLTEVESLFSALDKSDEFLETPAVAHVADLVVSRNRTFEAGTRFGHYEIIRQIGSGGMGEVYLAEDQKLDRRVAIKILNEQYSRDESNLERFLREAKAASALNHPNILVIHEIGESGEARYIVSEFIEGKTLREVLALSQLTVSKVLDVAVQIASALAAAHAAHLVHCDIKPENVMLRPDGYVKVLDFGLAKLVEQENRSFSGLEDSTARHGQPAKGLILGTVNYMSPEQAKGEPLDERTDIFSFGVVLYEMLAGRRPFAGDSTPATIASQIEAEPHPLTGFPVIVPDGLKIIVEKTLSKSRNERYQTMKDVLTDLKNLNATHRWENRMGWSPSPDGEQGAGLQVTMHGVDLQRDTLQHSSARRIRTNKPLVAGALVVAGLIIAAGLALGISKLVRSNRPATTAAVPFQEVELIRLTNNGKVTDAAISGDGKYVVYVADNRGQTSIWIRDVAAATNVEIVPPAEIQYYGGTFSRDSNYVYYIAKERNNSVGVLHKVSVQGGVPVKLIVDVDGPVSFSPDGKQFAFIRGSSTGERALMLANADGSEERKLASRTGYDAFSFGGPTWSPDGQSIACGAQYVEALERYSSVVVVKVADGSIRRITSQKWRGIGRISWLSDGRGFLFNANELGRSSTSQLWYLSFETGEAQKITRDLQEYDGASVTSDSTILVSKQSETFSSLWIAPNNDADRAKPILSHKEDDAYNALYYYRTRFSWTPKGEIIYTSLVNHTPSIWTMTAQGTRNKQLTNDPGGDNFPSMTSDGRYVIFVSDRTGFTNVWRMDSDGGNPIQLTSGEDDSWVWSAPDGKSVVYHRGQQGRRTLWRLSIKGGEPEQLTDYPSLGPVISPDGKWISCYYRPEVKAPWKLGIVPFNGGPPVKTFDVPPNVIFQSLVRWTPDGRSLAYIMNSEGIANIWIQPLDGGPPKQLTNFKSDQIFWYDWSPDGRRLGVSRGNVSSDVVLIKDLRRIAESPVSAGLTFP